MTTDADSAASAVVAMIASSGEAGDRMPDGLQERIRTPTPESNSGFSPSHQREPQVASVALHAGRPAKPHTNPFVARRDERVARLHVPDIVVDGLGHSRSREVGELMEEPDFASGDEFIEKPEGDVPVESLEEVEELRVTRQCLSKRTVPARISSGGSHVRR